MTDATFPVVGVVGLGLIGGGVALDLQRSGRAVLGHDQDERVRDRSRELGLGVADELAQLVTSCDVVVVAVPLGAVAATMARVRGLRPDVLVTDVASVKDPTLLAPHGLDRWVGGHPMAGNERSGIDAARPGQFDGAVWFLTPDADTTVDDLLTVLAVVRALAAQPVIVDAVSHDRDVALLSHLPHVFAYGLQAVAYERMGDGLQALGGGSFRDATRVAASEPAFWAEVLHANRDAVRSGMGELQRWVEELLVSLDQPDEIRRRLTAARRTPLTRDEAVVEVGLPARGSTLGEATARDLHERGAAGYAVADVIDTEGRPHLRLRPL